MPEIPPSAENSDSDEFVEEGSGRPGSVNAHDLVLGVALIWGAELVLGTIAAAWLGQAALRPGPGIIMVLTLASNIVTVFVVWRLVCVKYGKSFTNGFALDGVPTWSVMLWGALGVIAAAGATILIASYATDRGTMAEMGRTLPGLTAALVLAVIVPPFEEFYYRGFIQPAMNNSYGIITAVVVTTLWFGIAHSYQLMGNWVALLVVTTMGFVWSLSRALTKSLLPPLAAHWCYNITIAMIQIAIL